jgi:hypothetical protein
MQQAGNHDGDLRIGTSTRREDGKKQPHVSTWVLSSVSEKAVRVAAEVYGGTPERWADYDRGDGMWRVITPLKEFPIDFGEGDTRVDQIMIYFDRGVCMRRCTGALDAVDEVTGRPCECHATGEQLCKPQTRLETRLLHLPGGGMWRFTSHGKHVAGDFPARAAQLDAMAKIRRAIIAAQRPDLADTARVFVGAHLVVRMMKLPPLHPGGPGRRFPVVHLVPDHSIEEIIAGAQGVGTLQEIVAGRRPLALPLGSRPALAAEPAPGEGVPPAAGAQPPTAPPAPDAPQDPAEAQRRRAAWAQWAADQLGKLDFPGLEQFLVTHHPKIEAVAREFVAVPGADVDVEFEVAVADRRRAAFAQWAAERATGLDYAGLEEFYRRHHADIQDAAGEHVVVAEDEPAVELKTLLDDRLRLLFAYDGTGAA